MLPNSNEFETTGNVCIGANKLWLPTLPYFIQTEMMQIFIPVKTQSTNIFKPSKEHVNFRKIRTYSLLDVDPT